NQLAHVIDGDVARDLRVVETAVGVLLDQAHGAHGTRGRDPSIADAAPAAQTPWRESPPGPAGSVRGILAGSNASRAAPRKTGGGAPRGRASSRWPSRAQARCSEGRGPEGSKGGPASDLDSLRPSASSTSGRWA